MYNRYLKAAESSERRKVATRVAFVTGGIFDNRKLKAGILNVNILQSNTQETRG